MQGVIYSAKSVSLTTRSAFICNIARNNKVSRARKWSSRPPCANLSVLILIRRGRERYRLVTLRGVKEGKPHQGKIRKIVHMNLE